MDASCFTPSPLLLKSSEVNEIRSVLRSHSGPPDHLESTISFASTELARYDAEVERLHAQLKEVESGRAYLKSHYEDCQGLLSPIRRLPTEILVKICAFFCIERLDKNITIDIIRSHSPKRAMSQLAQEELLTLSRVCARWHSVCIGTPTLWTNIQLHSALWSTPAITSKMMALLTAALQRGYSAPLSINVVIHGSAPHIPALQLLAAHSERWQTVFLISPAAHLQHLASVQGRLPRLREATLWLQGPVSCLGFLRDMPELKELSVSGLPETFNALARLPLNRLHALQCGELVGMAESRGQGISPALSLIPHLSKTARFRLNLMHCPNARPFNALTNLPHITAKLAGLSIVVSTSFSTGHVGPMLAKIADSLTLPALKVLSMSCVGYPRDPLPWFHTQFLALSARSSFHTHLHTLDLRDSVITEPELVLCLSALPCLEWLGISDHQPVAGGGGADQLLISDSLLIQLTGTFYFPCLVPRLRHFRCRTLLQFNHALFLELLLSRLRDGKRFTGAIRCLPGCYQVLEPRVAACIHGLCVQKVLVFSFA